MSALAKSISCVRAGVDRIFFPAHAPSNLAVIRIVLGAYLTHYLWSYRAKHAKVALLHPDLFRPKGLAHLVEGPIDPVLHGLVFDAALVLSVLFAMGLGFRVVRFALVASFLWVMSYRNSWGFVYHTEHLVFGHLLVMSFAPAADRFSVDSLVRRRFANVWWVRGLWGEARHDAAPHWRYAWPVQVLLLVTGICYWVAGVAKLDNGGGFGWASDHVLLDQIGNNALRYITLKGQDKAITFWLFQLDARVLGALSMGSLLLELCAPLMIVHRRVTMGYAIALYAFHRGILVLMGIPFSYQLSGAAFVPFFRWDLIGPAALRHARRLRERALAWRTKA